MNEKNFGLYFHTTTSRAAVYTLWVSVFVSADRYGYCNTDYQIKLSTMTN